MLQHHGNKLKCLTEPNQLALWGNFDSDVGQNIGIGFQKCDNATSTVTCKSDEQIRQWMRDKYIIVLTNLNEFVSYSFDTNKMKQYSRFFWVQLTPHVPTEVVAMINRSNVILRDSPFGLTDLYQDDEHGQYKGFGVT